MTTSRTRTSAKLQPIPVADTMDFISGDAVIWGKVPKWKRDDDGQWVQNGTRHQWIARFLRGPDGEHIHFYCATIEEARKIYVEGFLTHRKDMLARINACVSMSFGLQSEWMKPVVVFLDPPNANNQALGLRQALRLRGQARQSQQVPWSLRSPGRGVRQQPRSADLPPGSVR